VVIVIIGILAAIAIPKLFGMTAKAKASEVGPAAGTWSKLQQAYVVETNK
jgi:type II secretory pathway pseudopilin PulG